MVKWIALILALIAVLYSADRGKVQLLDDRVSAIEHRQCRLMLVLVPNGTATVCAGIP